jgi:hypothetical protein
MTRTAMLFLRTALAMLVAGMALGAAGLIDPGWLTGPRRVAHTHLLLVGWLVNTVVGVAWWMFPRLPGTVAPSGVVVAGWAALNGGLLLRAGYDLLGNGAAVAPELLRWAMALSQLGGASVLAWALWRRVRPPSLRPRDSGGH